MGARFSQPRGPDGTTEASVPAKPGAPPTPRNPFPRRINSRTIVAPAAAFTMACLLFVYARTSIRAAKANAQRHRDADTGGEGLSLLAEHRRRHGKAERVEGTGGGVVAELGREVLGGSQKSKPSTDKTSGDNATSEEEEKLKALMRKGKKGDNG
ncbi:hypothetical protein CB0940_04810 [Cercospora beticola]|uniref:Uncharacterized protein n=1 Tax=Cercospora beticola TaxID=122368 RepID=A0A2G5HMR8_CERBT|nr:hypothetical protein CB0940_04810 [Cercospora beticola]PIA93849.1 hypothetical protein CB0940_04810 [Cercospora beticola]WPB02084.1 hypothetical protein RHO25_006718 [Cercospora beticola]